MLLLTTYLSDGVADLQALTVSKKEMLDVIRHNDEAEFANYFPQWANLALSVREDFERFVAKVEKILMESTNLSTKDFARKFISFFPLF